VRPRAEAPARAHLNQIGGADLAVALLVDALEGAPQALQLLRLLELPPLLLASQLLVLLLLIRLASLRG
jgi:hypothetical protein